MVATASKPGSPSGSHPTFTHSRQQQAGQQEWRNRYDKALGLLGLPSIDQQIPAGDPRELVAFDALLQFAGSQADDASQLPANYDPPGAMHVRLANAVNLLDVAAVNRATAGLHAGMVDLANTSLRVDEASRLLASVPTVAKADPPPRATDLANVDLMSGGGSRRNRLAAPAVAQTGPKELTDEEVQLGVDLVLGRKRFGD